MAAQNLHNHGINNATLEVGDAANGWAAHAPYDVIVINGSLPQLPESFGKSLRIGGRLFAIVGTAPVMEARLIQRVGDHNFSEVALFETDLAPLPGVRTPERFEF
jgi:protein-L-isoaspartate(D-aspartate) O-methyltransferase